jgi:hypothetical protein
VPLSSLLPTRSGDEQQPLISSMPQIRIGGQLLGDMGGFPGNCLKGGFGGVVGALWEVDDAVAHARPDSGSALLAPGDRQPVGAI